MVSFFLDIDIWQEKEAFLTINDVIWRLAFLVHNDDND